MTGAFKLYKVIEYYQNFWIIGDIFSVVFLNEKVKKSSVYSAAALAYSVIHDVTPLVWIRNKLSNYEWKLSFNYEINSY